MSAVSESDQWNRERQVRVTAWLCLTCTRNLACYRAVVRHLPKGKGQKWQIEHQFWLTAADNFLGIAVLDWCKLFGSRFENYHWRKIVSPKAQDGFKANMLHRLRMTTEQDFADHHEDLRAYRDKHVAHLDNWLGLFPPFTLPTLRSAVHLYRELQRDPDTTRFLHGAQPSAARFYRAMYRQAQHGCRRRFPRGPG